MTNPKAKTAEEVFNDYWIHGGPTRETCKKHFIKALESYADSVAEERVANEYAKGALDQQRTCAKHCEQQRSEGFRAGQERMRERVAKLCFNRTTYSSEATNLLGNLLTAIDSLEVEPK